MTAPPDLSTANPYVLDLVRTQDRGRFVASLFAPAAARARILALLAFDQELGRIPATVSEPMLGHIRFQWWHDLVERVADGGAAPQGHPVAQALAAAIPGLVRADLGALMDARALALTAPQPESTVEPAATVSAADLRRSFFSCLVSGRYLLRSLNKEVANANENG